MNSECNAMQCLKVTNMEEENEQELEEGRKGGGKEKFQDRAAKGTSENGIPMNFEPPEN